MFIRKHYRFNDESQITWDSFYKKKLTVAKKMFLYLT